MAMTIGQKAERVLRFIMGVRHPRVARLLAAHGLTDETLEEGWRLLQGLTENRVPSRRGQPARSPELVEALDAWENRWLPIAQATLARHEPAVAEWMFENLSQQHGPEVALSVHLFTTRVRQLEQGVDQLGEAAGRARALLVERGLSEDELAHAERLLERLGDIAAAPPPPPGPTPEEQKAAEDAMWAWYLEWSAIARAVIRDGNLLRALGFGSRRRTSADPDTDDETDDLDDEPAPTPRPAAGPVAAE